MLEKDTDDEKLRKSIITSGVAENLLKIYLAWPVNDINHLLVKPISSLVYKTSMASLIVSKNPYPGLIKLLDNTADAEVANSALYSILMILRDAASDTKMKSEHPHSDTVVRLNGHQKIYSILLHGCEG